MAIDTAVMEQLLQSLVKLQQQQGKDNAAAMTRLAKASGLDPKIIENTEKKLKILGDSAEESSQSVGKLKNAGTFVGSALADLAQGVMATGGNFVSFSAKAVEGTAKMSDFFDVFKDLPIIGTVASLFAALQRVQESNYEAFKSLSQSGINLGEGLNQLRTDALAMGMSLEDSVKLQKEFSDAFVLMGGSASAGAKNFRNFNKDFVNSKLGSELLNLGFNFQEINSLLPQYARAVGGLNKQQLADQEKLSVAVANYGKELDFIARLTGKSREQQQKDLAEQQKNAAYQAKLAEMTTEQREAANAALNAALAQGGKGFADMVQLTIAGLPAITDEARDLSGALPGVAEVALEFAAGIDKANSATTIREKTDRALARAQIAQLRGVEAFGATADVLAFANDGIANVVNDARRQSIILRQAGAMTEEAALARIRSERQQQEEDAKTKKAEIEAQIAAEKSIRQFGALISDTLTPIFRNILGPLVTQLAPQLPKIGKAINEFVNDLFDPQKRQAMIEDLKKKIGELLDQLFRATFAYLGEKLFNQQQDATRFQNFLNALNSVNPMAYALQGLGMDVFNRERQGTVQPQNPLVEQIPRRAVGTFGATGRVLEDFGAATTIETHGKQGVYTEDQLNRLMAAGTSDQLKGLITQLNNSQAAVVHYMKEIAENSRRNVEATRALNGDAFA